MENSFPMHRKVVYAVLFIFGCLFFTIVIGNHYFFRTTAFDYGVYNFAFWDYAHFHLDIIPSCKVFGETKMNFLQDHFSFTLMYFVPVYWLINWLTGTYTLLLIEVVLILWSGWAIYKLILLKTGDGWLGVAAVLYYFLLQGRYSAFSADSNICTLCSCFVPLFLYYFEAKKFRIAVLIFILSLFSREDMPLWFAFIFIVLLIWHRKEKYIVRQCLVYMLACVVYFILLFKVFIPGVESANRHYALFNYAALGKNPWQAFVFILEHPLHTIKMLFINHLPDHTYDGVKKEFYMVYLISGGFMLFYRPQYFIWFIPLVAQKMFNDDPIRWSIQSYYSVPIITMLPVSVFMILSNFKKKWLRYGLTIAVCLLTLRETHYKMNFQNRQIPWWTTVKENVFDHDFFHPGYNASKINADLKLIPKDARVCASASILPHLAQRPFAYEFPDVEDAEYLALFTSKDFFGVTEGEYNQDVFRYILSEDWKIIANDYPFMLLRRNNRAQNSSLLSNRILDSIECTANQLSKDHSKFIASNGELLDNDDARDTSFMHNGNFTTHLNQFKQFGFNYHGTYFNTGDLLTLSVWKYPAKEEGKLVVSCGKDFYLSCSSWEMKDSAGWAKIIAHIIVPDDHSDFRIYVWNNGKNDVWFDDLKIVRRKL